MTRDDYKGHIRFIATREERPQYDTDYADSIAFGHGISYDPTWRVYICWCGQCWTLKEVVELSQVLEYDRAVRIDCHSCGNNLGVLSVGRFN